MWLNVVTVCRHMSRYSIIDYIPSAVLSSLSFIYFIAGSLYLLISFTYFTHSVHLPRPSF